MLQNSQKRVPASRSRRAISPVSAVASLEDWSSPFRDLQSIPRPESGRFLPGAGSFAPKYPFPAPAARKKSGDTRAHSREHARTCHALCATLSLVFPTPLRTDRSRSGACVRWGLPKSVRGSGSNRPEFIDSSNSKVTHGYPVSFALCASERSRAIDVSSLRRAGAGSRNKFASLYFVCTAAGGTA